MKKILTMIFALAPAAIRGIDPSVLQSTYTLEYYGKYNEAFAAGEKLIAENPKEYFYQLRAGYLAYLAGHFTRSLELYQNALLLKPESLEPRLGKLLPLIALGKYNEAALAAQAVLRSDPKNYTARIKLAYAYYLAGDFPRSEKQYADLATDFPSDATVLMGLGWAQLKQGKKSPARQNFERVKLMSPDNKYADEGLAWAK